MDYMPVLKGAVSDLVQGRAAKALPVMQGLVAAVEQEDRYQEDEQNCYYAFDEEFEYLLFLAREDTGKEVHWVKEPFSLVYVFDGAVHMELGDMEAAIASYRKALTWNPVSAKARLAMADALIATNHIEDYYKITQESFPNIFHSEEMGQAYRNLARYYGLGQNYDAAVSCYGLSMLYEQSEEALQGLSTLQQSAPDKVHMPSDDQLVHFSEEHGFPLSPDPAVLTTAFTQIRLAESAGEEERAKRFREIIYDLKQGQALSQLEQEEKTP